MMMRILNKINFIVGIVVVLLFMFLAQILEKISRYLLGILQNFFYYFDPYSQGGYIDLFYDSLMMEFVGTAVYSGSAIFLPILLFEKFFKNIEINWKPAIVLLFLFFLFYGVLLIRFYLISSVELDFFDIIQIVVMLIGYFAGFIIPLFYAYNYEK